MSSIDELLQQVTFKEIVNAENGMNSDIIRSLIANFSIGKKQVEGIAKNFEGGTIEETARNVWNWLKSEIQYKRDSNQFQKIRLPARFASDKEGDCKSYALFAASVLGNFAPVSFRFANYDKKRGNIPTHVYTVVEDKQGEIIIDGVYDFFNQEKPYNFKIDKQMQISTLAGFAELDQEQQGNYFRQMQAMRNRFTPGSAEREVIDKRILEAASIYGIVGKIFLSPGRGAFLSLVALNVRGLANKLDAAIKKNRTVVASKWEGKLKGKMKHLLAAIESGIKKKPLLGSNASDSPAPFSEVAPNPVLYKNLAEANAGRAKYKISGIAGPEIAAIIALAAPVIAAMGAMLKGLGGGNLSIDDLGTEAMQAGGDYKEPSGDINDDGQEDGTGFHLSPLMIGGAALAAFLLFGKKLFK